MFITYGQQSNYKLLQYYGFVEAKNPSDVFVVPSLLNALKDLPYTDISDERVRAVEQVGLVPALQQVRNDMFGSMSSAENVCICYLRRSGGAFWRQCSAFCMLKGMYVIVMTDDVASIMHSW